MKALKIAPRVGKVVLERGELFEELQMLFPEYRIRVVELCKGTDRLRRPPVRLIPEEAPWRLSLGLHRHQLEPVDLGPWMQWQDLSNRQLCSKSPPLRLLISVFAQQVMSKSSEEKVAIRQRIESMSPVIPGETPMESHGVGKSETSRVKAESNENRELEPIPEDKAQWLSHGPKFRALPKEQQSWISKVHHQDIQVLRSCKMYSGNKVMQTN